MMPRQRKRIEDLIAWSEQKMKECVENNRFGPWQHHKARASALRSALAEIDRLTRELEALR
jgi:hypothetical protein